MNFRSKSSSAWHNTLKSQDYQVCITVIEARQLAGLNMDPVVCVQVALERTFNYQDQYVNKLSLKELWN